MSKFSSVRFFNLLAPARKRREIAMGAEGGGVHILQPASERPALSIQAEIMHIGEECRLHNLIPDLLRQQRAWRKRKEEARDENLCIDTAD